MSKNIEDLIGYDFHTPATEEVWEYVKSNFKIESIRRKVEDYNFITVQCAEGSLFLTNSAYANFIPTEKFKEIIGMSDKKTFTKADLKDGMKVVLKDGRVRFLLGVNLLEYSPSMFLGNGGYNQATYITNFNNDLTHPEYEDLSITKVMDRDGTTLFQRPPAKTQTEIELEKLQQQIADLQAQANKLQQTL